MSCSRGTKLRSCLGCPGCPPMWRLSCPAGAWGVGGGRLGGGRGVLAGRRQLRLELCDGGLELGNGRRQRIDLRLQAGAVGTGSGVFVSHAAQPILRRDPGKTWSKPLRPFPNCGPATTTIQKTYPSLLAEDYAHTEHSRIRIRDNGLRLDPA